MSPSNSDDIDDVMHLEKGRKRYKSRSKEDLAEHLQWKKDCINILREMTWDEVVTYRGLQPGTPHYDEIWQLWQAYRPDGAAREKPPRRPKP